MHYLLRAFVGLLLGAICGGVGGMLSLGLVTWFYPGSGFLGPPQAWAPLMAVIGLIFGAVFGGIVGLVVASAKMRKLYGAAAGVVGGWLVGVLLFSMQSQPMSGDRYSTLWQFTWLNVLNGLFTGIMVSLVTNVLLKRAANSAIETQNVIKG
jgi:hypothetical protein